VLERGRARTRVSWAIGAAGALLAAVAAGLQNWLALLAGILALAGAVLGGRLRDAAERTAAQRDFERQHLSGRARWTPG